MSAILLESGIVHYEVIGRGRPIVFLHGWVGSWRYWVPAMQTASTTFRAYSLDLWGFGDTAHDPERYPLERQVTLIKQFLGEMGIGKVAFVGHGLGGLVGLRFTKENSQMVDRIMAVDVPMDATLVTPKLRTASIPELVDWLLAKDSTADSARVDALKADPQAIAASLANPDGYSGLIGNITNPCLLVHGQADPAISPPPFTAEAASYNLHMMVLDQSGHFPMLDDPGRFNRLLTDFLALESGESPRDLQMKEEWKRRVR
jgi:pimeloyl-ACP methyl ester carboxylesterase